MRATLACRWGALVFDGKGQSLSTAKDYGDFELLVDWKIEKDGDSGIYLRGTPQVQIWDNKIGSGGLLHDTVIELVHAPIEAPSRPRASFRESCSTDGFTEKRRKFRERLDRLVRRGQHLPQVLG